MNGKFPHIETNELAATLRKCAELLTLARQGEAGEATFADVDAAIANAHAQAAALDTIKDQSYMPVFGDVPFEMMPGEFPLNDGRRAPFLIVKEESGDVCAFGFLNPTAARKIGGGILALALTAFGEPATEH